MPEWKSRNTSRARELRNAASPAEQVLWSYLSRSQTGTKFSRQMPVGPYFADFLSRELRLVIECDGISHDRDPQGDVIRDQWMEQNGYTVLRFTNADLLGNVEGVVRAIVSKVQQLQASHTHP
jgi:very-short-patch-repair endonuclease